jgi:asparagine synthase (glutamine-hydrolysing)
MCGITGFIDNKKSVSIKVIQQMTDSLSHRGPDGEGIYISEDKHVALGHRRLAFFDLSVNGQQPMTNGLNDLVISFNGEIYNFKELKNDLKEYPFKTNTDTEVILAGYQKWGIDVLNKLNGMFAFALIDKSKKKLFLVRDRFGIKPLYYTFQDSKLLFASELKAILASNKVEKEIDFGSFIDYFVYRYVPSPKTIWTNINKLPPATYLEIELDTLDFKIKEYWKLISSNRTIKDLDLISNVNTILLNSVKSNSCADVPVGSFLSGGYDSSALVLFMKKLKLEPETFSIGFSNWEKSEDHFAKIVAKHLDIQNSSIIADEKSLNLVDLMPDVYDEPIADISIVPTYMVSQLARTKMKAVLSGEGADEIFAGYTWQQAFIEKKIPNNLVGLFKNILKSINTVDFYAEAMAMGKFEKNELKKMLQSHLHKYIPNDLNWFYRQHYNPELSPLKSIQYLDIKCFMGELVLTKIDRASMANSLEVRVPFLNHNLFEFIFSLNENCYFKKEQTKYVLFKNIEGELPSQILNRKKQGFVGPDSYYMNIDWYKNQFKNCKLVELKIINQSYLDNLLQETYNWKLWKLLIMEKWLKKWC